MIYNILIKRDDKFILSKGLHWYSSICIILQSKKIISKKEFLNSCCQKNSLLGVHPDYGNPGIEASTGAVGHGLGIASGLGIGQEDKININVVISDGELMEGDYLGIPSNNVFFERL